MVNQAAADFWRLANSVDTLHPEFLIQTRHNPRVKMRKLRRQQPVKSKCSALFNRRAGAAALDYILGLGVILPLVAFAIPAGKRIIQLTYEMVCTLVAWPMM